MRKNHSNSEHQSSSKYPLKRHSTTITANQFTFTQLWQTLLHNYARNQRDFITAYGGAQFYNKVESLYRDGLTDQCSQAVQSDEQQTPSMPQKRISAYLSVNSDAGSSTKFSQRPSNSTLVKSLIITNELLTNEAKLALLIKGYERGIFYAILTLKRSPTAKQSTDFTRNDWSHHSVFQSHLLNIHPIGKITGLNRTAFSDSTKECYQTQLQLLNSQDRLEEYHQSDTEESDSEASNLSEGEQQPSTTVDQYDDDGHGDQYNNIKNSSKRFVGLAAAVSAKAYRLEIYQQFFYHFFYITKRTTRDIRLLPHFF